ncbi:hypothetical protein JM654_15455 [Microbacterium oxydans]|nr:hypothetical protein [Microbacterium oxydans]
MRKEFSGRLVNTIDVDYERAPLVTWAFEQYATGAVLDQSTQRHARRARPHYTPIAVAASPSRQS